MFANAVGSATVRAGGDTWYFITADYGFGHQMERDTGRFVQAAGGKVLGLRPLPVPRHHGFLRLPPASAIQPRQGRGPRHRRRRHGELHQAGARIRPDRAAARSSPAW
jgi:hypothetical protein